MSGAGGPGDVAVVIPHYGDPQPTASLARQLLQQAPDLEVIIVDDCSPSPMAELEGVRVLRRDANGGFGSAVNTGVSATTRQTLLVLNSDLEPDDNFVTTLLASAASWWPAVVAPTLVRPDGLASWTGRHFPTTTHQTIEWLTPLARWRDKPLLHEAVGHDTRSVAGTTTVVDWVIGAALLMPREDFCAVGGFDERFFMNCEEVDLQRRLRQRGLPAIALGIPTVVHVGGGSSDPLRRRGWLVTSRLDYAAKWGFRRRLLMALRMATGINLVWNTGRRIMRRPVQPLVIAREELALLGRGATTRGPRSTVT